MDEAITGMVTAIGMASAFFTDEQLIENGMTTETCILIVEIDRHRPIIGRLFAERVQISPAGIAPA